MFVNNPYFRILFPLTIHLFISFVILCVFFSIFFSLFLVYFQKSCLVLLRSIVFHFLNDSCCCCYSNFVFSILNERKRAYIINWRSVFGIALVETLLQNSMGEYAISNTNEENKQTKNVRRLRLLLEQCSTNEIVRCILGVPYIFVWTEIRATKTATFWMDN